MSKRRKVIAIAVFTSVIVVGLVWSFVVPRELKNLSRFASWRETHVRAAGFVDREPVGSRVAWEEFGPADGTPVVVLHAGLCTTTVMVGVIEPLARASYRVIALDSRGHGKSPNTAPDTTYEMMTDDVVAVMDARGVKRAAIVGWSDGGNIGLDLARRYGDRVTKVVAFGANRTPAPDGEDLAQTKEFQETPADSALFWPLRRMYEKTSPTPTKWPELLEREKRMAFSQPNWSLAQLGAISAPVLFVNGEHDTVLLPYATEMKNAIPGSALDVVAGEDHMLPVANPEAAASRTLAFLAR
jgi:pimeloyl-ACP methyl ester carboxylesterase